MVDDVNMKYIVQDVSRESTLYRRETPLSAGLEELEAVQMTVVTDK